MNISYNGESGEIYVEVSPKDIEILEDKKELFDTEQHALVVKDKIDSLYDVLELNRDKENPTKLLSLAISEELFNAIHTLETGKNHIERIGGSLSVEFFKRETV